jgi:hypothetical protein
VDSKKSFRYKSEFANLQNVMSFKRSCERTLSVVRDNINEYRNEVRPEVSTTPMELMNPFLSVFCGKQVA